MAGVLVTKHSRPKSRPPEKNRAIQNTKERYSNPRDYDGMRPNHSCSHYSERNANSPRISSRKRVHQSTCTSGHTTGYRQSHSESYLTPISYSIDD